MDIYEHWSGQKLYAEWCGSPFSDRARYWTAMNRADKQAWEELAKVVNDQHRGAVEALRFYADESNWTAQNPPRAGGSPAWRDHGGRARDFLGGQCAAHPSSQLSSKEDTHG